MVRMFVFERQVQSTVACVHEFCQTQTLYALVFKSPFSMSWLLIPRKSHHTHTSHLATLGLVDEQLF